MVWSNDAEMRKPDGIENGIDQPGAGEEQAEHHGGQGTRHHPGNEHYASKQALEAHVLVEQHGSQQPEQKLADH